MTRVQDMTRDNDQQESGFRRVKPGQTVSEAILEEMVLRGHSQADMARDLGISEGSISRWLRPSPVVPDRRTANSSDNVDRLIRYLRLRSQDDYAALAFNSQAREVERRFN